jgi:hypothetical protein
VTVLIFFGLSYADDWQKERRLRVETKSDSMSLSANGEISKQINGVKYAGQDLKTAAKLTYWAVLFSVAGTITVAAGAPVVGVIVSGVGAIIALVSPAYIMSAGNELEKTTDLAR